MAGSWLLLVEQIVERIVFHPWYLLDFPVLIDPQRLNQLDGIAVQLGCSTITSEDTTAVAVVNELFEKFESVVAIRIPAEGVHHTTVVHVQIRSERAFTAHAATNQGAAHGFSLE